MPIPPDWNVSTTSPNFSCMLFEMCSRFAASSCCSKTDWISNIRHVSVWLKKATERYIHTVYSYYRTCISLRYSFKSSFGKCKFKLFQSPIAWLSRTRSSATKQILDSLIAWRVCWFFRLQLECAFNLGVLHNFRETLSDFRARK